MKSKVRKVIKNIVYAPYIVLNRLQYAMKHVKVGKNHTTNGVLCIRVHKGGSVTMGNDVRINSRAKANPIGAGDRTYFQVLRDAKLVIGDNVGLSNCAITTAKQVIIGNHVRIGAGVKIYDTDFHALDPMQRTANPEQGTAVSKEITILDYAFIGAGAFILKGVTVGEKAIVGAGSVVTKTIPAGEIWAGNPAKKIGEVVESINNRDKNES